MTGWLTTVLALAAITILGCAAPAIAGWLLKDVPGPAAEALRQKFGVKHVPATASPRATATAPGPAPKTSPGAGRPSHERR